MKTPRYCKDCKHSKPAPRAEWNLRCLHPIVNAADAWALSKSEISGSEARTEREKGWFRGKCGMRGALWEPKP